ncbi:hypothetical protein BDV59DRAFT_184600 [Aspergillus ambiguus]|uniref:uncharacterized protein n=1 Tax=Aspergillus ambiguus TaxID=176160 RepID=UPI003CCD595B
MTSVRVPPRALSDLVFFSTISSVHGTESKPESAVQPKVEFLFFCLSISILTGSLKTVSMVMSFSGSRQWGRKECFLTCFARRGVHVFGEDCEGREGFFVGPG